MKYYKMEPAQIARELESDLKTGLRSDATQSLRRTYGKNQLAQGKKTSWFARLLLQFKDFMIIILILAAIISALVAFLHHDYTELIDAGVIVAIVLLNGVIGVVQEGKAEKALASLQKISAPKAKVIRDGCASLIDAAELLPGDIILLEAGDRVPADGVIVEAASLKTEETALTGESLPVDKSVGVIEGDNHPIGDMTNMVFSGTMVVYGSAKVIVTEIGMNTQIGKIAGMLQEHKKEKTPLQIQMAQLGKLLGLVALAICAVIFVLGLVQGKGLVDMFLTAVSLAVAAIPEGLAATVTVLLALGVQRLAKENAVIRKLSAVETLGSASVICTDKTGTLTQNKMTVKACFVEDGIVPFTKENYAKTAEIVLYGSLCNDADFEEKDGKRVCIGDPTEGAIIEALGELGKTKRELDELYPKMGDIPFDSERKRKTTLHIIEGENVAVLKGAPDVLFARCENTEFVEKAAKANDEMAAQALRVLAVAVRKLDVLPSQPDEELENHLTLIGLIGMIDPPRPEAIAAIQTCVSAGIRPVMITGDHVITAKAIAEEFGIFRSGDIALTGSDLEQIPQAEFEENVEKYSVYARVNPEHKVRIVQAWQKKDKIVAMTGDGVNDAPALQRADIGCAMGLVGTDVAKGAADLVLMDDNFATIVSAVREGRGIYNNIRKTVKFLLSGNIGEVLTIFLAMILAFDVPLLPLHLLWINVVTDAFPALALGMEKARSGLMDHPPRAKKENLIHKLLAIEIGWQGALIGILSLLAFCVGTGFAPRTSDPTLIATGQTMAFAVLAISQIIHAYDVRSKHALFQIGVFSNKVLNIASLVSLALVLCVMLIPGVSTVFGITALSSMHWLTVIALSFVPFIFCEIAKIFTR